MRLYLAQHDRFGQRSEEVPPKENFIPRRIVITVGLVIIFLVGSPAWGQHTLSLSITSPNPEDIAGGPMGQVGTGFFGDAMTILPDINGDDTPDFLIGASGEIAEETKSAGRAYLISGADGTVIRSFQSPNPQTYGGFGRAVAGVGDVDGDNRSKILVAASGEVVDGTDSAGRVYLFSGTDGKLIRTFASPNVVDTGSFGAAITTVEDLNGDGTRDVLVGAQQEQVGDTEDAGRAYLYSGTDGRLLHSLKTPNPTQYGLFGGAVAGVGDVNGDATPDVVVGAPGETITDSTEAGRVYVFSGADGQRLQTISSPNIESRGHFGESVEGIPDVDEDGAPEIVVGAPQESMKASSESGRVYLISGADGTVTFDAEVKGVRRGQFGDSVSEVGDVNADGSTDILVGAPTQPVQDMRAAGRAFLISGADGSVLQRIVAPKPSERSHFGSGVAGGRDLNGDGTPDCVIGASEEMVGDLRSGRAYVYTSGDSTQ